MKMNKSKERIEHLIKQLKSSFLFLYLPTYNYREERMK
jgi:hypothetical protein